MPGMWVTFARNEASNILTGAVKHDMNLALSRGIRDSLAIIEDTHKRHVINRGGGAPIRRRWTTRSGELSRSFGISFRIGELSGSYGSDHFRSEVLEKGKIIKPKTKKALKFQINGKWIITKRSVIPPRPTLDIAVKGTLRDRARITSKHIDAAIAKGK